MLRIKQIRIKNFRSIVDLKKFLYLILDYSHNHYTFKHFGV